MNQRPFLAISPGALSKIANSVPRKSWRPCNIANNAKFAH
jgi:hypothetical protein